PCSSVNQKLPSGPLTIATGRLLDVGIGNSLRDPVEEDMGDGVAVGVTVLVPEGVGVALPLDCTHESGH
ncbi:MAG: hypothetical protein ACRDHW_08970, partial [Ktedonobacteraceae bacterium]